VTFEVTSRVDQGEIHALLTPPTRKAPEAIVLHLRHPDTKPIAGVTVNGRPGATHDAESVILSGIGRPCRIVVTYGR